jgi:hypothetical protein
LLSVSDSLCVAIALSSSERDTFYINPYIFFYCKVILMSCSPANLTENITNSCDLKCKLVTDYPSQGITVTGLPGGPGLTALIINWNIQFKD